MRMKFICNFLGKLIIQLAAKKAYYANQQNWFIVLFCIFSFILKCRKKNIIVYNDNTIQQKKKRILFRLPIQFLFQTFDDR